MRRGDEAPRFSARSEGTKKQVRRLKTGNPKGGGGLYRLLFRVEVLRRNKGKEGRKLWLREVSFIS